MTTVAVVIPVWGERYTEFFVRHIAPTIRSNLPAGSMMCVATTNAHSKVFADSPQLADVVVVADKETGCKYARATYLLATAMRHVIESFHIRRFVLQPPDCYISRDAIERAATTKRKIITAPGIRVCQRTFLERHGGIGVDFLKQWMKCLHPITLSLATSGGSDQFNAGWPSVVYEITPTRITARAFHRHPIMVEVPTDYVWRDAGTIDDRFVESLGYSWDDYDNLTDSDQGYIVELCDDAPPVTAWCANSEAGHAIEQFQQTVTPTHRRFFQIPYLWHYDVEPCFLRSLGALKDARP